MSSKSLKAPRVPTDIALLLELSAIETAYRYVGQVTLNTVKRNHIAGLIAGSLEGK